MSADRDLIIEAIYRALVKYDRERRQLRDLRSIARSGPPERRIALPTIKRGTVRSALAVYLADVVLAELAENEAAPDEPDYDPSGTWQHTDVPVVDGVATLPDGQTVRSESQVVRVVDFRAAYLDAFGMGE